MASKRIRFLSAIRGAGRFDLEAELQRRPDLFEAVAEDTPKDRVAHYFLRIAAALADSWGLREFFLRQESLLFELRSLKECNSAALLQLQRHLRDMLAASPSLDVDLRHVHGAVSDVIDEQGGNSAHKRFLPNTCALSKSDLVPIFIPFFGAFFVPEKVY